jgi:hypothetical protein
MKMICALFLLSLSIYAKIENDITIPTGKIVNETLYWTAFNDFVEEQETAINVKAALALVKESLKTLSVKEKMYLDLNKVGASSNYQTESVVLRKMLTAIEAKVLAFSLDSSNANLSINRARMQSALEQGFEGNLEEYIQKNNSVVYNSKCQERYYKVHLNRVSYDQMNRDYERNLRLYSTEKPSISFESLIDSRQKVAAAAIKVKSWNKLSQSCLKSKVKPIGLILDTVTNIDHVKIPAMPARFL